MDESALKTGPENSTLIPQARCAEPNRVTSQQAIGHIPNNIDVMFFTWDIWDNPS